ncbi:MAG: hypothetical protein U0X39_12200 [Bacteroidales bacterium]
MKTLDVNTLYLRWNVKRVLVKWHAGMHFPGSERKGLYWTGCACLINNGEASNEAGREKFDALSGSLAEWNGERLRQSGEISLLR